MPYPDEGLLWLPGHRALVSGDLLLGSPPRICPESWLLHGQSRDRRRGAAAAARPADRALPADARRARARERARRPGRGIRPVPARRRYCRRETRRPSLALAALALDRRRARVDDEAPAAAEALAEDAADRARGRAGRRGRAAAERPLRLRYQYLAGGVNTGSGWATWNPDGSFVTRYVAESRRAGIVPVFSYYMLLQSKPGGGDELHADLSNLRNAATMKAYWADLRLFFARAAGRSSARSCCTSSPTSGATSSRARGTTTRSTVPAVVPGRAAADRGRLRPGGREAPRPARAERDPRLPPERLGNEARHRLREAARCDRARLRDALGPLLPLARRPLRPLVRGLLRPRRRLLRQGRRATRRHGSGPPTSTVTCSTRETFVRLAGIRMAAWQIPLGNTVMRAMNNTWGHYQDNRVQWLLGARVERTCAPTRGPASSRSCSAAVPTGRRAPATRGTTASRTRSRSTATRGGR